MLHIEVKQWPCSKAHTVQFVDCVREVLIQLCSHLVSGIVILDCIIVKGVPNILSFSCVYK